MSGFSDRRFWMLEGFGYSNSEEMKAIHTSYNGSVTLDTTTIPGRNCVNISSGGYIDIVIPRHDGLPWADLTMSSGYNQVVQAKVYLDADSYTNLLTNSFLMELWSSNDQKHGWGLSPNTSVNQDNFYIKSYDVATDLANTNPNYIPPGIPQRTLIDVKFMFYSDGSDDGLVAIALNNYVVAYTSYNTVDYGNHGAGRRFRGVRLHGLANQSGPTLWSDLMVYAIPNDYRHFFRGFVDFIFNTGAPFNSTIWGGSGPFNVFVPMNARVYDITPTSTANAVNQFSTLGGGGNPVTALSTLDTNSYVTSTAASQAFRLRVDSPDAATGDNSTAVTVTDTSEVLATQYRIYGKDLGGNASSVFMTMADDSSLSYRYRYYKLRMSELNRSDVIDGYLNKVQFLDSSLNRLSFPVGATMRLNNVNDYIAQEYRASNRASNTTEHTAMLTTGGSSQMYYYSHIDYTGTWAGYSRAGYADYILDMGVGNIGPDWYALQVYQPGVWERIFQNFSVYGSSDGATWYLLGDWINTNNETTNNLTANIINRRHPSYVNGIYRNISGNFNLNALQYEQVALCYTGDPIASGVLTKESRTPIPWAQFKNYSIGFNEV